MLRLTIAPLLSAVLMCCGPSDRTDPPPTRCMPDGPALVCQRDRALTCGRDGTVVSERDCAAEGLVCDPRRGCAVCLPNRPGCATGTNQARVCNGDGTEWVYGEVCDSTAGFGCDPETGACSDLCANAEASQSYIGCEYYAVPLSNGGVSPDEFEFAVVIANPHPFEARVEITRGGSTVRSVRIPDGMIQVIRLPWLPELHNNRVPAVSAFVRGGAYKIRSNMPVTAYQFNPLEYERAGCGGGLECFSYSNDASLLLPVHVLHGNYLVLSYPGTTTHYLEGTVPLDTTPGFFAVIGADDAPIDVAIDFSARVQASLDGAVRQFAAGERGEFALGPGDVLQIVTATPESADACPPDSPMENDPSAPLSVYCRMGSEYDLTGTEIRASGRVAMYAGHNCAFVPFNRLACDHLEESLLPLEAWGKDYVISATEPLRGGEPNVIRLLSGHDGNRIAFDPAEVAPATTLDRGELLELETTQDFRVTGSEAFLVGQFLVGQDYGGWGTSGRMALGDPSMSLGIPVEQLRTDYAFLAPGTFRQSYVNVAAPSGQDVFLDGAPVVGWRQVAASGWQTARVRIAGGPHRIEADERFGIVVYGFGTYTSYMYPGGLDLAEINVPF